MSLTGSFEQILEWSPEGDYRENLVRHLQRDGYSVDDHGRITGGSAAALAEIPLEQLTDPSSIYEHLERIAASTESDPGVAISGAKALVEATTKLVLSELQVPYDEKADVPALVKAAQQALALYPDSLAPTKPGVEITKRILSNLSQLAIGVAELRNQYGPDHGRTTAVVGLRPRHAHLAVGAASTYCRMLLETLGARSSWKEGGVRRTRLEISAGGVPYNHDEDGPPDGGSDALLTQLFRHAGPKPQVNGSFHALVANG